MDKKDNTSIFYRNIQKGIDSKILLLNDDESRIIYYCSREYSTSFKNPEEKVRASYFVELVLDYGYPSQRIDIEVPVERRIPDDRADIVVYEDDVCMSSYFVVECKKDGITDAEFKQAIEQAFGNANSKRAKYAIVVAGTTKTAFNVTGFKSSEREKNVIADIPIKYGEAPKYRFIKGDELKDLQIVSREELIRALQKCHDTVWQAGKLAPTVAFDEVSKLLFCKLKDEKETKKNSFYKFQVGTNETPKDVFGRIDTIYQNSKKGNGDVFNENIKLDEKIVYSVVEHLQELAINKIDLDTKGIAFERFMEDFFKGKMGQFFTPRAIIKFCIDVIAPKFSDKILDPACGSGGFLLNSLDLIRKFSEDNYEQIEGDRLWHNFAMNNLYGIEINEQIARVCKMNMIIHDDGHTNIISTDSLQKFSKIQDIHKKFCANSFDIIFTNPPFGADIIQKEKDDGFIEQFELGSKKKKRTRQISEILFIERCIEFLKEGTGLMAIVLPDKITVNTSLQYVRDFLLEKAQIIAIISLPDFAFSHFDANVKSSVIFLRKKYPNESLDNYNILMAKPSSIGYKATGKDDINNDLIAITDYLRKFIENNYNIKIDKKVNNKIFTLTLKDVINNRLDPNAYHHEILEFKNQIVKSHLPKLKLSDCLSKSVAGEWGEDPEKFFPDENYQLCYVLRNTNFDNNFNLNFSDVALRYIKKDKIEKIKLQINEILVEKSGGSPTQPVGRVAIIKNLPTDKPTVFSNFLQKIVVDNTKFDPDYLFVYLQTLYKRGYMVYIQNQTTGIKNLIMNEFMDILVLKPEIVTQKKISNDYIKNMNTAKRMIEDAYILLENSIKQTAINIFK